MGWLEKIDLMAFTEAVFWSLLLKIVFSANIDLLMGNNSIFLGGLNGADDE